MNTLPEEFKIQNDFPETNFEDWKKTVEKDLEGVNFEQRLKTKTYEGIYLQFIYTKKNTEKLQHMKSKPGFENFVRGTRPDGYLSKSWLISQETPYPLPEDFNSALRYDLGRGQNSINIILDKTVQSLKFDKSIIGKSGLIVTEISDLKKAFESIELNDYPIFIKAGYSNLPFLMLFDTYLGQKGYNKGKICGAIETDPIDFLVREGYLPIPPEKVFDEAAISAKWAIKNYPGIKTIGISSLQYHDSGANIVQEIGCSLSTAAEYIKQMLKRGIGINEISRSIRFTIGIGSLYFLEVAKLRAVKLLWSSLIDAFGGDEDAKKIFIHARTSYNNQTVYDPYVNMLRTTTEAFSAVIGGVDSLHTNWFDETIGLPDEFSRRIARNTQIILNEESHLNQLIDPVGGSYFVENLTDEITRKSWAYFQEIEKRGGILRALESGFIQEEIEKTVSEKRTNFAKRRTTQIGINAYANIKEEKAEYRGVDYRDTIRKRYSENSQKKYKEDYEEFLKKLDIVGNSENLFKYSSAAIEKGATIFEVASSIRRDSGKGINIRPLKVYRTAEIFEELRDASLEYKRKNGVLPKVFLLPMGPLKQNKARSDFSKGFFEIGGFEVVSTQRFHTIEAAIDAGIKSNSKIIVICSTDETYPELVPPIVKGIKAEDKDKIIIVAGYPKDYVDQFKEAGVDDFIFLGCDAHKTIKSLMTKTGVIK